MAKPTYTCRARAHVCSACAWRGKVLRWTHEPWNEDGRLVCIVCGGRLEEVFEDGPVQSHGIMRDGIPGGLEIRHGLCNADGTPRRYDSMTDIRREAARRGMTISGETPKVGTRWI